jgi:hypothetical protein
MQGNQIVATCGWDKKINVRRPPYYLPFTYVLSANACYISIGTHGRPIP